MKIGAMIVLLLCTLTLIGESSCMSALRRKGIETSKGADGLSAKPSTPCKCNNPDIVIGEIIPAELNNHITSCLIRLDRPIAEPITVSLYTADKTVAFPILTNITFPAGQRALAPITVFIYAKKLGETFIFVNGSTFKDEEMLKEKVYRGKVTVVHSYKMREINMVIGWIYFVIWSISFYPQLFQNWMKRSVVGLNFDFLAYNITGFIFYSIYNAGLYWSKALQDQYFEKYGGSVIPVPANDVFFAIHAAFITLLTIIQCFVYQSANQRVSLIAKVLVALMWLFGGFLLIPVAVSKMSWITYITNISYVKLAVTLIKYVPQAYMNYTRKSTQGWAIGFVHCDFVGGVLSVLQVFFLAYNNNQWSAIFGNFTKFGLASVSIVFDVLFLCQHYVLYKEKKMTKTDTTDIIIMNDQLASIQKRMHHNCVEENE